MSAQRRRFTIEEKLDILHQAQQSGITAVLRKHHLSYSVFHRWKDKLADKLEGVSGGIENGHTTQLRELVEENLLLKKIIANQAMMLELKDEELRRRRHL